jgi:hypothetical protein
MLLPQLEQELDRAAHAPRPARRAGSRAAGALAAAVAALLLAAPVAHAEFSLATALPSAAQLQAAP